MEGRGAALSRQLGQLLDQRRLGDLPGDVRQDANNNYSKDPELEKLVAEGGAANDAAARKKAYSAAIKIMTEKAYWLPLFT